MPLHLRTMPRSRHAHVVLDSLAWFYLHFRDNAAVDAMAFANGLGKPNARFNLVHRNTLFGWVWIARKANKLENPSRHSIRYRPFNPTFQGFTSLRPSEKWSIGSSFKSRPVPYDLRIPKEIKGRKTINKAKSVLKPA